VSSFLLLTVNVLADKEKAMAGNSPRNFKIADSARAKNLSIIEDMNRFDPSENWLPAVVWSTSEYPEGNIIESGPGITVCPEKEIAADQSVSMDGLKFVFPCPDQTHFEDKTLGYDSVSGRFSLTPN
jgi:hypothetical protein